MWRDYPSTTPWQQSQEQQHSFAQPPMPAPQPGMGWLPPVANDRTNFWGPVVLFIVIALFIVLLATFTLASSSLPPSLKLGLLVASSPSLLLTGALAIWTHTQARRWKGINQRRQQAAAWGFAPEVPLAQPQPVPNLGALPLPLTIKLKVKWFPTLAWACGIVGIGLLASLSAGLSLALFSSVSVQSAIEAVLRSWDTVVFSMSFPLVLVVRASRPQQIELTPEGVSVKPSGSVWGKPQMIRWQEARLFAIRDGKPGDSTVRYELSGPLTVVTFDRILRPRWWTRFQPAQSFGEYNAQMDALLALISAHTGLLLYDVRQHD